MLTKQQVLDFVDWESVLKIERTPDGHQDVMPVLFGAHARLLAEAALEDDPPERCFAFEFSDGTIVLIADYFGTCWGCDCFSGADDDTARDVIRSMVTSARLFVDKGAARSFCESVLEDAA